MTNLEFIAALAAAADQKLNSRVALVLRSDTLEVQGIGTHTGEGGCKTAIVNVVQHLNDVDMARCWVIATYQPTPMCEGMCSVRALGGLAYLSGGRISSPVPKMRIESATLQIGKASSSPLEETPAWDRAGGWLDGLDTAALTTIGSKAVSSLRTCLADGSRRYSDRYMPDSVRDIYGRVPTEAAPIALSLATEAAIFMRLAYALVGQSWTDLTAWNPGTKPGQVMGGTNIGVVAVHNRKIIGWGLNSLAQNMTFHAETVMLGAYLAKHNVAALPSNCRIYTTLQPCRMCAGFIVRACPNAKVYYGLSDQGLRTVLTDGATNGCSEAAISTVAKVDAITNQQTRLNATTNTRTPIFLSDRAESNTFVQFGQQILNRQRALIDEKANLAVELGKLGAPSTKPISWAQRSDANNPEVKRKALLDKIADDDNQLQAINQCIGLLKIVGEAGLTTTYGWSVLEALYPQLKAS